MEGLFISFGGDIMTAAKKYSTFYDIVALGPGSRCELIDGEISEKGASGGRHSSAQISIGGLIYRMFHRKGPKDGNPGGWWIKTEISTYYSRSESVLIHDIAGWRRDRVLENPTGFPITVAPDWVCEVCHNTHKKDSKIVPEILLKHGVPWYWFVDVERDLLIIYELKDSRYTVAQTVFSNEGVARLQPFESVEFDLAVLFGADPD